MKPSRRRKHDRTPNAIVALLDAAWAARERGRRDSMRGLAKDAVKLMRLWGCLPHSVQMDFPSVRTGEGFAGPAGVSK